MQTVYYTTEHFIRHKGNVVDLEAYRRGMAEAAGGQFRSGPVQDLWEGPEQGEQTEPEEKRSFRRKLSDWLEMTATLTVAAVAITICLQFVI